MGRKQSFLRTPFPIGGAAILGYAGVRALLDLRPSADADIVVVQVGYPVIVNGGE